MKNFKSVGLMLCLAFLLGFSLASVEVQAKQERILPLKQQEKLQALGILKAKHKGKRMDQLSNSDVFEYVRLLMLHDLAL